MVNAATLTAVSASISTPVCAAILADAVGESGHVLSVDSARAASRAARATLADHPQVRVLSDSVRRALTAQPTIPSPRAKRATLPSFSVKG